MALLTAQGVSVAYPTNELLLQGLSLRLDAREFLAVVGPSGGGNTLLLATLAGLRSPLTGEVYRPTVSMVGHRATAVVFPNPRLLPWRRVLGNVTLGLESLGLSRAERRRRALEKLTLLGIEGESQRWPKDLSEEQCQRVALARALAVEPQVLFMDTPFSSTDSLTRHHLQEELNELRQSTGLAVLMVTHDTDQAVSLADRIIVIAGGTPATVHTTVTIDLPLGGRRHQHGFWEQVEHLEEIIQGPEDNLN